MILYHGSHGRHRERIARLRNHTQPKIGGTVRHPKEIPGLLRLVQVNDHGRTIRRLGVNFRTDVGAYAFATDYLHLPDRDLDMPLAWALDDGTRVLLQTQER